MNIILPEDIEYMLSGYAIKCHEFHPKGQVRDSDTGTWYSLFTESAKLDASFHGESLWDADVLDQAIAYLEKVASPDEEMIERLKQDSSLYQITVGKAQSKLEIFQKERENLRKAVAGNEPAFADDHYLSPERIKSHFNFAAMRAANLEAKRDNSADTGDKSNQRRVEPSDLMPSWTL